MEKKTLKQRIKENSGLKQAVHRFIMHPVKTRPNWWIRIFGYVYLKRGKGSVIYRSVRKDLPPFNRFSLGRYSVVEDFSCLNNAVGDLTIGDYTRIGLRNTIIGPAAIAFICKLWKNSTQKNRFSYMFSPSGSPTVPRRIGFSSLRRRQSSLRLRI